MPEACPTIPAGVPGVFLLNESVLTALWPQPFTPRTVMLPPAVPDKTEIEFVPCPL